MRTMETGCLIAIDEFCASHNVDISFISSLDQSGLIEIKSIEEAIFIEAEQLPQLEKFVHLYYELDINLEGIETINYLLERINCMGDEMRTLKNRLRLYESGE